MEEKLKNALAEGEKILWTGRPESFETMDKTHKRHLTIRAAIHTGITLALIISYLIISSGSNSSPSIAIIAVILAFCAFNLISPITDAGTIRSRLEYAVTDRRLVMLKDDLVSVPYDTIESAAFRTDGDGHVSLLCGKDALKLAATKWRGAAVIGSRKDSETGKCTSFVLYAIPEAEKVKAIVAGYLTLI